MPQPLISNPFVEAEPYLYRYNAERTEISLDIMIGDYGQMFNAWDFSPSVNRELDRELFEYLTTCLLEIPASPRLRLVFHLPQERGERRREEACTAGLRNYCRYQIHRERRLRAKTCRRLVIFAFLTFIFLFASARISDFHEGRVTLLSDGFCLAGWVFGWDFITMLAFQLREHGAVLRRLKRLMDAPVRYIYSADPDADPADPETSLFLRKRSALAGPAPAPVAPGS